MVDAGGIVVEVLATKSFGAPSRADLDSWIQSGKIPVTSVKDVANPPTRTIDALERRELGYIVDLKTMKIVERIDGTTTGIGDTAVKIGMARMLKLLGK